MVNSLPVPFALNTPQNRLCVDLYITSDVNTCSVSLYEHRGVYWFSLRKPFKINSTSFVSLRNCVNSLKATVKSIGFTLQNTEYLSEFVKTWECSIKSAKEVA